MLQLFALVLTYGILVNIIGLIITASDKRSAIRRTWRVSEKTLFIIAIFGGGPGIYIACLLFRHKIRDMGFMLGIPAVLLIQISLLFGGILLMDSRVEQSGSVYILAEAQTPSLPSPVDAIIVPGALVYGNGSVSGMLADRLDVALRLYKNGISNRILVTGDHGTDGYDEVNAMRLYLQERGVPREVIFMDHAGFDTYDSLYRARDVFMVKTAVITTQEFHLVRALYIGRRLGLDVWGVTADTYVYPRMSWYRLREYGARSKAFLQVNIFKPLPRFLGEAMPVSGNGIVTDDKK
ncbi:MAG TPA: hypothetical protein DD727_03120 [Clostridiales bacterium]|nr:hypothetical protein [Clostridiales bacterium]